MGSFTSSLKTEWLEAGENWRVIESFRFYSGEVGSGMFIDIIAPFDSDLASIPKIVRWLVPKVGKDAQGAVCHDKMYRTGEVTVGLWVNGIEYKTKVPISRGMADSMYHQAMMALKVGRSRRKAIYYGLVVFGWIAWNRYRKQSIGTVTATTR